MGQQHPPRTLGEIASGVDALSATALAGLALVVIGSIGPWVTAPLSSASGVDGDGKWTLVLAAIATFLLLARGRRASSIRVGVDCAVILALGIYDAVHIHHVVARATLYGTQLDHVGWGVYAVIAGAAGTILALYRGRERGISETLRDWTRKDPGLPR